MAIQTETFTTAGGGYEISLTLTEREVDHKANTSLVSYKFTVSNSGGGRFSAAGCSWNISIAGQSIPVVDYSFDLSKSNVTKTVASGSLTVQHDLDGSLAMPYRVCIPDLRQVNGPGAMELTGVWALTKIPRIPAVYCPDGFIGDTVTVRVDALDKALRYTLSYAFGQLQGIIAEKVPASEIPWEIPRSFYTQLPEAKEGVCVLTCKAFSDDTEIGEGSCDLTVKVDPKSNAPVISVSVEDTNPETVALTGDPSVLVRYCSDARVSMACEGKNSAYVEALSLTHAGVTYQKSPVDIYSIETGEFRAEATDSRGITATRTVKKELIPYIKLTCNLGDNKPNADGEMLVKVTGNYFNSSFGAESNSLMVQYRYKIVGGEYGDWIPMAINVTTRTYTAQSALSGLDYRAAYVLQARATDRLHSVTSAEYAVRATPVFDWDENDFNVNGSFRINNETVADFVVARGENSIWTWEKWNSGIAKCWGITGEKSFAFTGDGPVYRGSAAHSYTYPIALTEVDSVRAHILSEGGVVPVVLSVSDGLQVSAVRLCGGSASVTGRYSFRVLGRWK